MMTQKANSLQATRQMKSAKQMMMMVTKPMLRPIPAMGTQQANPTLMRRLIQISRQLLKNRTRRAPSKTKMKQTSQRTVMKVTTSRMQSRRKLKKTILAKRSGRILMRRVPPRLETRTSPLRTRMMKMTMMAKRSGRILMRRVPPRLETRTSLLRTRMMEVQKRQQ